MAHQFFLHNSRRKKFRIYTNYSTQIQNKPWPTCSQTKILFYQINIRKQQRGILAIQTQNILLSIQQQHACDEGLLAWRAQWAALKCNFQFCMEQYSTNSKAKPEFSMYLHWT
jgi:hypothetical protein